MINGYIEAPSGNPRDIVLVSLDIRAAFLQGLRFDELTRLAKRLGYEQRHKRNVYIIPPENIWRHFRDIVKDKKHKLYVNDHERALWILLCLACMYGFTDAPLLFQMALVYYLCDFTDARKSVYDDNHLYWLNPQRKSLTLTATVHVDDILVAGPLCHIDWLQKRLEERFGALKRKELPLTHTGIEYEMINPDCLLQHQEPFVQKLKLIEVSKERRSQAEELCTPLEHKSFRSTVCSCLWATITRGDAISELTNLQQELQSPKVKHMLEINLIVKRLQRDVEPMGLFDFNQNSKSYAGTGNRSKAI